MKFYNHQIKKKTIHLVMSLALSSSMLTAGCASQAATTTSAEIIAGENQRVIQGQILSIAGNEIRLSVSSFDEQAQPSQVADGTSEQTRPSSPASDSSTRTRPSRPAEDSGGSSRQQPPDGAPGIGTAQAETIELTIPVGTEILTTQGKTTTFSRLAGGDRIQVLLESTTDGEVVVGVWMVDATETEAFSDATANH